MNELMEQITLTPNFIIVGLSVLLFAFTTFLAIMTIRINTFRNSTRMIDVTANLIAIVLSFLMLSSIILGVQNDKNDANTIESEVVSYHYSPNDSKITLKQPIGTKTYHVEGTADNYQYEKGDVVKGELDGNTLHHITKINNLVLDRPFTKFHTLSLMLALLNILVFFDYIFHSIVKNGLENKKPIIIDLWRVFGLSIATILFIVFVAIVTIIDTTDTRNVKIDGQVVKALDDGHSYVIEDKHSVKYIVRNVNNLNGHVKIEVKKPSHRVINILDK